MSYVQLLVILLLTI